MQAQFHLQQQQQIAEHASTFQQQPPPTMQTLRLRDNSTIAATPRASRKRKNADADHPQSHIPPHMQPMPGYPFGPGGPMDYSPAGMPPPPHPMPPTLPVDQPELDSDGQSKNRPLTQSKRAEQNRKAQRAFRERRDAHVKTLESRSQLLDDALVTAEAANRRWEECRALVDQLRIENTGLRNALSQVQIMHPGTHVNAPPTVHVPPHLLTLPRVPSSDVNDEDRTDERT